jgi:tRNA(Ile)-lysidine synthase
MIDIVHQVEQSYLSHKFSKNLKFMVGVSGGVDSIALVHALHLLSKSYPMEISCIYINHQIHPDAKQWGGFVKRFSNKLDIEFISETVSLDQDLNLGIEGAARKKRYEAFYKHQKNFLVLAHHEDDQLETLFLQLARGSGVKGLSCMAELDVKRKIWRPLLSTSKEDITHYQKINNLRFVEDESNKNNKFDRNFIRNKVIPQLKKRFPSFARTASRSVRHIANEYENQKISVEKKFNLALAANQTLKVSILKKLSNHDLTNVIRFWLNEHEIMMPNKKVTDQILNQVLKINSQSRLKIQLNGASIRAFNDSLHLVIDRKVRFDKTRWRGQTTLDLGDGKSLEVSKLKGSGLSLDKIESSILFIDKPDAMNTKIKIHRNRPSRSLKYLFQQYKVPVWDRVNYPCLYVNKNLIGLAGMGIDIDYQVNSDEVGINFEVQKKPPNTNKGVL